MSSARLWLAVATATLALHAVLLLMQPAAAPCRCVPHTDLHAAKATFEPSDPPAMPSPERVDAQPRTAIPSDRRARAALPPVAIANTRGMRWVAHANDFARFASATDKCTSHQYHPLYAKVLGPFRDAPPGTEFDMLEIGLGCTMVTPAGGYSLFKQFLPNVRYRSFEYDFGRCLSRWKSSGVADRDPATVSYLQANVVVGDQGNETDLNRAILRFGPMDIIVDDGSHRMEHQRTAFRHLFLNMLRPGGVYIVEDLQTNFWRLHKGMFGASAEKHTRRKTMVHYVHDLITALSHSYWDRKQFFYAGGDFSLDADVVAWVEDVTCIHEACAITKKLTPFNRFATPLIFP